MILGLSSIGKSDCPNCFANQAPFDSNHTAASDGSGRRTIRVQFAANWGNPTNTDVWNATQAALDQWNTQTEDGTHTTGYYFVIDQSTSSPDYIIGKGSVNGCAETQGTAPPYLITLPDNFTSFSSDEKRGRVGHEIGHGVGLDNASCGSSIMNTSDENCHRAANDVTPGDVAAVNKNFGPNRSTACTATGNGTNGDPTPTPTPTPEPTPEACPGHCPSWVVAINQTCFGSEDLCTYPNNDGCETGLYNVNGCCCAAETPILIDVLGNGFDLTNSQNGVNFDMDIDGLTERLSWTMNSSDDAWLALDRNENGLIDDGSELFGNHTSQPNPTDGHARNGFLALAEFDKPSLGGNSDGSITRADAIFEKLKLWQDNNHNGISEATELHRLQDLGLKKIELDYRLSRRSDANGNFFRFRAKIRDKKDAQLGRWAWDVVLARGQ
jgi:hypothetical protein